MSLDLTSQEVDAIWAETEQHCPPATSIDRLETIYTVPRQLGSGYTREVEICAGLDLRILNKTSHDLTERFSENEHPVQFAAYLSGVFDCGNFVRIDAEQSYIGGSGIQPCHAVFSPRTHRQVGVDIHMTPALLHQFFATPQGSLPADLQPLIQDNNWQHRFSPRMTNAMRSVVQQIIACPFMGAAKRLYLQGKVFELMALQLDDLLDKDTGSSSTSLKPDTIARIHYAAEILRSHLENPPSQTALAQQVGVSDRTLQKGFKSVFGITPFAYLTRQRMNRAEHLLRQADQTVAEVANLVGYANPAQFAAAFKRQFGISPRDCLHGKKLAENSLLG